MSQICHLKSLLSTHTWTGWITHSLCNETRHRMWMKRWWCYRVKKQALTLPCLRWINYPDSTSDQGRGLFGKMRPLFDVRCMCQAEIVSLATAENTESQIRFWGQRGQEPHPSIVTRITHSWKLLWIAQLWVINFIPTAPEHWKPLLITEKC